MRRSSNLIAALAVAALAFSPSLADARAGAGSSSGSRGGRTYSAPPSTNTAPGSAAPMERSYAPSPGINAPSQGYGPSYGGASRTSGFTSGLMGGLLGAGIGGLLLGNGFFGGGGTGGFGFIGFLLQMVLLFFVARWLFRMFARRQQPAFAGPGGMNGMARTMQPGQNGRGPAMGGGAPAAAPVAIGPSDYSAFDRNLHEVQAAWSNQDLRSLQNLATPEMVGYFADQLSEQSSRGVRNTVTDVKLEQGDLSEAWSEGGREFATVAMRFSMIDVTVDASGRVVDGNPNQRAMATELWTFVRARGGRWLLSAIQQTR